VTGGLAAVVDGGTVAALAELTPPGGGDELTLRRSWPRGVDHLLLEYVDGTGSAIAGQWHADRARGGAVAAGTPGATWLEDRGVVLQPLGADRRLRALAGMVAEPGATLIVHRPERRAVVRRTVGRTTYAKVVRPTKVAALVAADGLVRATTVPVPELVMVDPGEGIVEWAELPGRSLHDLLGDEAVPLGVVTAAAAAAGHAVRAMHSAPVSEPARHHTAADEVANMARWVGPVGILASTPPGIERALDAAVALLSEPASAPVLVHRDLHDKQILVEGDEAGMIDVDTIAKGEAAVDLANLLVHLELRAALGVAPSRTQAAADSFLDAYRPSADVRARIGAYAAATRVRLACVYAFRPAQAVAAAQLLAGPP